MFVIINYPSLHFSYFPKVFLIALSNRLIDSDSYIDYHDSIIGGSITYDLFIMGTIHLIDHKIRYIGFTCSNISANTIGKLLKMFDCLC